MDENVRGLVSAVRGGSEIARESRECQIWVEFGSGEEVKITFCQFSFIFFKIFSISSFVLGSPQQSSAACPCFELYHVPQNGHPLPHLLKSREN